MGEALVGSVLPTIAVIVVAIIQRRRERMMRNQLHEVRVELNGRLSQLLNDADAAGELRGRESERDRGRLGGPPDEPPS